jgi:hypothetical protein
MDEHARNGERRAARRKGPPAAVGRDWAAMWREGGYASPPALPNRVWAWQFLRRNPEYVEDWERVKARALAAPTLEEGAIPDPKYLENWRAIKRASESSEFPPPPGAVPPPPLTLETIYDWAGRERWGLSCGYHDPESFCPEKLRFLRSYGVLTTVGAILTDREGLAPDVREWYMLASFNLACDLRAQLRIVEKKLRKLQGGLQTDPKYKIVKTPRPQRKLWPFYLFLLDAFGLGATAKNIADSFPNGDPVEPRRTLDESTIHDRLGAALARIKPRGPGGYLVLADMDDETAKPA